MENGLFLAIRRRLCRRRARAAGQLGVHPVLLTLLVGVLLASAVITMLELRLRPVVSRLAVSQVNNSVTAALNSALAGLEVEYAELVSIQRADDGTITAITSDMGRVGRLRSAVVEAALAAVGAVDVQTLGVPMGSLFDMDLLWAKGPEIQVHGLVVGTVSAQVRSEFQSAGINQTVHRILVDVTVPLTVLLPEQTAQTQVDVSVCAAETVIVGQVPETYLNWSGSDGLQAGDRAAAAGAGAGGT